MSPAEQRSSLTPLPEARTAEQRSDLLQVARDAFLRWLIAVWAAACGLPTREYESTARGRSSVASA
jgi:hypothetical protein